MSFKIQVRRGTTSEWTTTNPVLSSGELGYDTDLKIFKIGDGVAAWNSLAVADKDQQTAAEVPYINTTSELDAANVQAAIDELAVILASGDVEVDLSTAAGTALVWNAQSEQFDVDFADNTAAIAGESTTTVINPATLGTVLSNKIASQADAEAGTDNTVLMTPLRTAQAIAELAGESGGTGSANVTNYEVVINASDTWARDQITVVETEDFILSESSEYPLSATVNGTYSIQSGAARYSTLDGVLLESRAGVSFGFWDGATRVQAFLNDVLVLDGVKFGNTEIIQESMGGIITIDPNLSILAPTNNITYNKLVVFIDSEEAVSGDGVHAVNDATHIYRYGIGESTSNTVLQKINKETFVQEQEVILPAENLYEVFNIAIDSTHVYILTGDIDDVYEVQKYLKSDLSFVAKETLDDLKLAISQDDDYLYIGGVESGGYVLEGVQILDKTTLKVVNNTTSYGSNIESIAVDGQYIYGAGGDYEVFSHPVSVWDINSDSEISSIVKLSNDLSDDRGNPADPLARPNCNAISYDNQFMAVAAELGTRLHIFKWDGDNFGIRIWPDINPPGTPVSLSFSPDGNYLAALLNVSPWLILYKRDGDSFIKLADDIDITSQTVTGNSGGLFNRNVQNVIFSPNNEFLIVRVSNKIFIYKKGGDNWDIATQHQVINTTSLGEIDINDNSDYIVEVLYSSSGSVREYNLVDGQFVLSKSTSLSALSVSGAPTSLSLSRDGETLVVGTINFGDGNNFIYFFKKVNDQWTKLESTMIAPSILSVDLNFNANFAIATTLGTSNLRSLRVFQRQGDAWIARTDLDQSPSQQVFGNIIERTATMSRDGSLVAMNITIDSFPVIAVYQFSYLIDKIADTADYAGILKSVILDEDFIYAAGEQEPVAESIIVKYSKDTLEVIGTSAAVGGAVDKIEQDGDFIYALSVDGGFIKQYAKSDLSLVSTLTISNMQSFTQDSQFVYAFETLIGELSKATKGSLSYNLTKSVSGITSTDDPIVDIDLSNNNFSDVSTIQEAWGLVYRLETAADSVKLYATEEPVFPADTTVKLKVVK